jgi:hypothetical protein
LQDFAAARYQVFEVGQDSEDFIPGKRGEQEVPVQVRGTARRGWLAAHGDPPVGAGG